MASRSPILTSTRCLRCHLPLQRSSITIPRTWSRPISAYGYTQAKALVYSENGNPADVLSLHTHSLSPPHSNLLTLRTLTAPLNPADINQIQGTYPTPTSASSSSTSSIGTPTPSTIPGNEACFEVLSTGAGVTTIQQGDWVIPRSTGLGTWRTHVQCPEDAVLRVVARGDRMQQGTTTMMGGVSARQVGTVSVNPVTAWRLLRDFGPLEEGGRHGGGWWYIQNGANSGVGRYVSQLGRLWGLKGIAVVRKREDGEGEGSMQALRDEMVGLGAERCVTDEELNQPGFREQLAEWTNGGREEVRLGLNCVGGPEMAGMVKAMGKGGTVVTYGAMSKKPLRLGAASLIFKDLRFLGFWVSRWAERFPEEKRRTVEEVLELYRQKRLVDVPYTDVPWEWDTKSEVLLEAVQGTLEGFRKGKGIFVFGDM